MIKKNFPFHLKFKHTFKLSSAERTGTDNLYLYLENEGAEGWGEAVFPPYLNENNETSQALLKEVYWVIELQETFFDLLSRNALVLKKNPAFACAVQVCLMNWYASKTSQTLEDLLMLKKAEKPTSFTIGICSNTEITARINESPEATYFKLKVNEAEIERIVLHYTSQTNKPFVVDANQGFTSKEKAKEWAEKLHEMGVQYFEQPFDKDDFSSHAWLKSVVQIPIIADESFQKVEDLDEVEQAFDGINVKIIKSGGLLESRAALYKAKAKNLITILGCMSGSTVSINAASTLSSLADFVDLDGKFLIKNDPFQTGEYKDWL
ncbi:hypothetical protein N8089_02800 [Flavobacteriales bacterium]|nr:hypothetical protein [Flavobacteriales bacterium]